MRNFCFEQLPYREEYNSRGQSLKFGTKKLKKWKEKCNQQVKLYAPSSYRTCTIRSMKWLSTSCPGIYLPVGSTDLLLLHGVSALPGWGLWRVPCYRSVTSFNDNNTSGTTSCHRAMMYEPTINSFSIDGTMHPAYNWLSIINIIRLKCALVFYFICFYLLQCFVGTQ